MACLYEHRIYGFVTLLLFLFTNVFAQGSIRGIRYCVDNLQHYENMCMFIYFVLVFVIWILFLFHTHIHTYTSIYLQRYKHSMCIIFTYVCICISMSTHTAYLFHDKDYFYDTWRMRYARQLFELYLLNRYFTLKMFKPGIHTYITCKSMISVWREGFLRPAPSTVESTVELLTRRPISLVETD